MVRIAARVVATVVTVAAVLAPTAAGAEAGGTGVTKGAPTTATTLPAAGSVVRAKGITRTVLSVTEPANAPGQVLYLTRVRIAPKSRLTEHFHDGTQIASVQSGVLTYRITSGTVTITGRNGTARTVTGPRTVRIRAGESLVEGAGLTHYGSNATAKPVVILTAALIAHGAGLSTPVGTGATGETLTIPADLAVTQRSTATVGPKGERTVGTLVEVGESTDGPRQPGSRTVRVDATIQVAYTNGGGPFTGIMTWLFGDGSTLVGRLQGLTVPTPDGGATFAASVGIVGGTGAYAGVVSGTGTYTGSRSATVGAPLTTESILTIQNG